MDDGGAQLRRHGALACDDQHPRRSITASTLGDVDAGEGEASTSTACSVEHVHRRPPRRLERRVSDSAGTSAGACAQPWRASRAPRNNSSRADRSPWRPFLTPGSDRPGSPRPSHMVTARVTLKAACLRFEDHLIRQISNYKSRPCPTPISPFARLLQGHGQREAGCASSGCWPSRAQCSGAGRAAGTEGADRLAPPGVAEGAGPGQRPRRRRHPLACA